MEVKDNSIRTKTAHRHQRPLHRHPLLPAMLLVLISLQTVATVRADGAARLRTRLDAILTNHKEPRASLGARVIELPSGRILYDKNGIEPLIPASNMKLIVLAAAIDTLGKDYEFTTVLAIKGTDLVIIGGGDPTLGDEKLAKKRRETITALFHIWAAKLQEAGVQQIPGNLIVDDFIFDHEYVHANWPTDQYQKWYEAPVGGLNFNANCTGVRVKPTTPGKPAAVSLVPGNTFLSLNNKTKTGKKNTATVSRRRNSDTIIVNGTVASAGVLGPITVPDPGLHAGAVLKTVLASKGICIHGEVIRQKIRHEDGSLPDDCHIVAVHRAPLTDALNRAGKDSLGMMAESLFKLLGHEFAGKGNWTGGSLAVNAFLDKAGVPDSQRRVDEGSGLSRQNRLSAAAATRVLRYMFNSPQGNFDTLRDSLAQSGIDGTLSRRMRSSDTKGRIFAKTGYVNGVRTLAGYVRTKHDRWLAFAFYYNKAKLTSRMKKLQDQACRVLVEWPEIAPAQSQ